MDITKEDSKMLKGVAILAMLMLHLFCRTANLPYTPLLWIGNIPFVYYLGLFGDICVSIFCFISGYAHFMQNTASPANRWKHLLRFMIVFWIIVVLSSVVGLLTGNRAIPGNGKEFLLNCLTLRNSYNGAWWYANTYILLNVLQPFSRRFAERCPVWVVLSAAFVFYTVGYGIRFWGWGACDHAVLQWIITHIGLLGTSYFPYMIGMVFCRKQPIGALRNWISLHNVPFIYIYMITITTFIAMIVLHGIVPSLFVAVLTATATIVLLCICPMPHWLQNVLRFFGAHSTNIWLTHMFFYTGLLDGFVFRAKYPLLILLLMLLCSLAASYVIRWISKPILKFVR